MHLPSALIAHRGASAYAPENTMAAFEKARLMGTQIFEFDVKISADGALFIFHDDSLQRICQVNLPFAQADSAWLRTLDAGSWFSSQFAAEPIPLLTEVLSWLEQHQLWANIELKPVAGEAEKMVVALANCLQMWSTKRLIISSFDVEALGYCQQLLPQVPRGLLMHYWSRQWEQQARSLACVSLHVSRSVLTAARIAAIKRQGYVLCAYTVNRQGAARRLLKFGVDAVFSDYPDLLQ